MATELITNGGMEGVYVSGVAPNWTLSAAATGAEETSDVYAGSSSQKVTIPDSASYLRLTSATFSLTKDRWYRVQAAIKVNSGHVTVYLQGTGYAEQILQWEITGPSWLLYEWSFRAKATASPSIRFQSAPNTPGEWLVDAVSIQEQAVSPATHYNVELRTKTGLLKQYLTPFIENISWEWNRVGGCGNCSIVLMKEYRDIEFTAGDDIQIRLRSGSTSKLVYRGYVAESKPRLDNPQTIALTVKGYFERLKGLVVHELGDKKTYESISVSSIVNSIVSNFVTYNVTNVTKGTIDTGRFTPDTISFKCSVAEALDTLANLEGNVEYGIDEDLTFFWRVESDSIAHKFFVGIDVQQFDRNINWNKMYNKVYFEGGEVNGSPYLRIAEATDSQTMYFLSEKIVSNSAITTSSVADQYISSLLKQNSGPKLTLKIKIPNTDKRLEDNIPIGAIAVCDDDYDDGFYKWGTVGNGGSGLIWGTVKNGGSGKKWGRYYKSQIDRIVYTPSDTDERVNMTIYCGETTLETPAKIKQIEQNLSSLRQRVA